MLRSSGFSWKLGALIVRYSQKKECISLVFYCFGTTGLIQVRFSAKCASPNHANEHFNQIEN